MDRRAFLKTTGTLLGAVGAGQLLVACGNGGGIPSGERTLNMINASFPEMLLGEDRRFAFGLTTLDNELVDLDEVEVYTRAPGGGEAIGGPYEAERFDTGAFGLPVYLTRVDAPEAGPLEVVAVSGRDFGAATVSVVPPESSQVLVPGAEAVRARTPTFDDPLGFEEICTREPDCPFHDASLDELLAQGRPVVVLFATPAYCQTAVCGPAVDTFIEAGEARDYGDVAFHHVEIFTDAGVTVADPILEWGLPSEPWLFSIDADGRIAERLDGPMIRDELVEVASRLA